MALASLGLVEQPARYLDGSEVCEILSPTQAPPIEVQQLDRGGGTMSIGAFDRVWERNRTALLIYCCGLMLVSWFGTVIVHELGHAVAATLLGIPVRGIAISPFGWGRVWFEAQPGDPASVEWGMVAAAGIGSCLLVGYAILLARRLWHRGRPLVQPLLAMAAAWLIIVNPAYLALAFFGVGDGVGVASGLGLSSSTVGFLAIGLVMAGRQLGRDLFRLAFRPFQQVGSDNLKWVWRRWLLWVAIFFVYQMVGMAAFGIE